MDFAYSVASSQQSALKKVLDAEPYEKDSFSTVGYTLRESGSLGLPAGKLVLYFSSADETVGAKLKARLALVEGGVTELAGEEKQKAVSAIKDSENEAAAGFGSLFG